MTRRHASPEDPESDVHGKYGGYASDSEEETSWSWPESAEYYEYVYERQYEAGIGFPFPVEGENRTWKEKSRRGFHLHIGAGRLGLGLVIPAVARSATPLGILQRPSEAWAPLMDTKRMDVMVNEETAVKDMIVVRDLTELPDWDERRPNLFVLSEDPILLQTLVRTATSFSMSLGPFMKDVVPLLSTLPLHGEAEDPADFVLPVLYAAENDHKMVEEVAEALAGRVEVRKVMVDRICTAREIGELRVEVACEPYEGEMVVMAESLGKHGLHQGGETPRLPPPFKGNHVRLPSKQEQAEYFTQRKFLLVNGSHTTLAFLTLCLRQPPAPKKSAAGHEGPETYTPPADHELINWSNCGEQLHQEIWAWAVARLLILLTAFPATVLMEAHDVTTEDALCEVLLAYAEETLQRFASTTDSTARVLQGGVANRWETRLKTVDRFLQPKTKLRKLKAKLVEKAGLSFPYIKQVVARLCEDSHRFTGLELERNEGLVKEDLVV